MLILTSILFLEDGCKTNLNKVLNIKFDKNIAVLNNFAFLNNKLKKMEDKNKKLAILTYVSGC